MNNSRARTCPILALTSSLFATDPPRASEAGQALASRPDLLPSEYLDELQKLQDNVPTFSNEIAFRIVEEELKREFGEVFELVEPEPVAGECNPGRKGVKIIEKS